MLISRVRRRLLSTIIFAISLSTLLLSAEFGARVYLVEHPIPQPADKHPVDYYAEEAAAMQTVRLGTDGFYHVVSDFHGHFINVEDGRRRTVDQPADAPHTLYFFGASTGFDVDADDAHTIASQLQVRLGSTARVENVSVTAATIFSELAYLKTLDVRPGDVIIFYGGVNESMGLAKAALAEYHKSAAGALQQDLCVPQSHYQSLALVELACRTPAPSLLNSADFVDETASGFLARYDNALRASRQYAAEHGAQLYVVLQPMARADNPLWAFTDSNYPGQAQGAAIMYPLLQRRANVDLWHLLDQDQDVFVDTTHMVGAGYTVVARAIYDALTLL